MPCTPPLRQDWRRWLGRLCIIGRVGRSERSGPCPNRIHLRRRKSGENTRACPIICSWPSRARARFRRRHGHPAHGARASAEDFGGARYQGCNEALVLSRPDIVRRIHERTSRRAPTSSRPTVSRRRGSNSKSTAWASAPRRSTGVPPSSRAPRAMRTRRRDRPRFVAGSMGPTGMLISSSDPALSKIKFEQLRGASTASRRATWSKAAWILLLETMQDLLEVKAAIAGIVREFAEGLRRVPIQAQPTLDRKAGCCWAPTCARSRGARRPAVDVIGLELLDRAGANARLDPLYVRERALLRKRRSPTPGLPLMGPNGETIYPEKPAEPGARTGASSCASSA